MPGTPFLALLYKSSFNKHSEGDPYCVSSDSFKEVKEDFLKVHVVRAYSITEQYIESALTLVKYPRDDIFIRVLQT